MKKLLTILLSLLVVFTLAGCNNGGGDSGNTEDTPIKIGVATQFEGDTWVVQKDYYEKELGPALNVEFMFSEKLSDANGLVDFIDQAYAAECQGVINYLTQDEPIIQGARKCQEYGMYFVTQNSKLTTEVADLEYNVGHCGADPQKMAAQYKVLFSDILSDGQPHSLMLYSCGAGGGMAMSHVYSSIAILESFQEAYGLTYEKPIEEIVVELEPRELTTGRDDIKIYIYPGLTPDIPDAVQTLMQNGDYDIFAACALFQNFTTGIDAIEKSLNKNITIVGTVQFDDNTAAGFATKDSFGNSVLDAAMLNPLNPANAVNVIELVNAIKGANSQMKENGKAVLLGVAPFICKDEATYNTLLNLDKAHGNYIVSGDAAKALTVLENPAVTYKDIDAMLQQIADLDYVLKSVGQ